MKKYEKPDIIVLIPGIALVIIIGKLTDYNIIYTVLAGAIGGLIGYFLKKMTKR